MEVNSFFELLSKSKDNWNIFVKIAKEKYLCEYLNHMFEVELIYTFPLSYEIDSRPEIEVYQFRKLWYYNDIEEIPDVEDYLLIKYYLIYRILVKRVPVEEIIKEVKEELKFGDWFGFATKKLLETILKNKILGDINEFEKELKEVSKYCESMLELNKNCKSFLNRFSDYF